MKHLRSGCHTAFKYLVLYFKFTHFALNQIQLYFLSQETSYTFVKWTGITVSVQWQLILNPSLLPAFNFFGHWSLKMHLLKTKLTSKNLPSTLVREPHHPLQTLVDDRLLCAALWRISWLLSSIREGLGKKTASSDWQCNLFVIWASLRCSLLV